MNAVLSRLARDELGARLELLAAKYPFLKRYSHWDVFGFHGNEHDRVKPTAYEFKDVSFLLELAGELDDKIGISIQVGIEAANAPRPTWVLSTPSPSDTLVMKPLMVAVREDVSAHIDFFLQHVTMPTKVAAAFVALQTDVPMDHATYYFDDSKGPRWILSLFYCNVHYFVLAKMGTKKVKKTNDDTSALEEKTKAVVLYELGTVLNPKKPLESLVTWVDGMGKEGYYNVRARLTSVLTTFTPTDYENEYDIEYADRHCYRGGIHYEDRRACAPAPMDVTVKSTDGLDDMDDDDDDDDAYEYEPSVQMVRSATTFDFDDADDAMQVDG